jgi:protein phosphatase 1H
MLNRFKNAVSTVVNGISQLDRGAPDSIAYTDYYAEEATAGPLKFPYSRPEFLQLNTDEVLVSADHVSRPILVPRDISRIPWSAGYAEWVLLVLRATICGINLILGQP